MPEEDAYKLKMLKTLREMAPLRVRIDTAREALARLNVVLLHTGGDNPTIEYWCEGELRHTYGPETCRAIRDQLEPLANRLQVGFQELCAMFIVETMLDITYDEASRG